MEDLKQWLMDWVDSLHCFAGVVQVIAVDVLSESLAWDMASKGRQVFGQGPLRDTR